MLSMKRVLVAAFASAAMVAAAPTAAQAQDGGVLDPVVQAHADAIVDSQQAVENLTSPSAATLEVDSFIGVPCGLDGYYTPGPAGGRYYHYTIKNCHSYTVRRRVDVNNGRDGACHRIGRYNVAKGYVYVPFYGSIRGMVQC